MRLASALVLASAVGLTSSASAQVPPPRDASNPESRLGTAVVRGRVTDAETGAPMPRVTVSLSSLGRRAQLDTTSNADGAFQFTRLPAGSYTLIADPTAKRATHRPATYGQVAGKPFGKQSTIVLQDGQVFDKADIALPRSFVISARVVDEDGEPVADMLVKADGFDSRTGGSRSRTTDDRGLVRLWGYSPGTYKVCAIPQGGSDRATAEAFVRTCYPSATSESETQSLTVTDSDPPEIEIRLRRSRLFRISGFVLDASGAVAPNASISFVTIEDNSTSSRNMQNEGGAFTIRGIAPGDYYIRAEAGSPYDKTRQSGYAAVSIQSSDVENLAILMSPPSTIRGRLVFEGGPSPSTSGVTVRAHPARGTIAMISGRSDPPSQINTDLTFELPGLSGPYTVEVDGLRDWVAKSMRYRGEERINIPTEFRAHSDPAAFEIILTNRPGRLHARVFDEEGQPTEDSRIVLFPTDPRQWETDTVLRWAVRRADVYEFAGLRPAEYFVAVVPDGMAFGNNRRAMEDLSKLAERITVLENDQRTIDLSVRR